jgi:hypothetical protein
MRKHRFNKRGKKSGRALDKSYSTSGNWFWSNCAPGSSCGISSWSKSGLLSQSVSVINNTT